MTPMMKIASTEIVLLAGAGKVLLQALAAR
jgi:hypothetical protein